MAKKQYWVYYSSLDFAAEIQYTEEPMSESGLPVEYRGPFETLKSAREYGKELVNGDIGQYQVMKWELLKGKPKPYR